MLLVNVNYMKSTISRESMLILPPPQTYSIDNESMVINAFQGTFDNFSVKIHFLGTFMLKYSPNYFNDVKLCAGDFQNDFIGDVYSR